MTITQEYKQGLVQACIKGPDDDGLDGLGDLVRGHTAQKVEERKKVKTSGPSKTMQVVKKFCETLKRGNDLFLTTHGGDEYLDEIDDELNYFNIRFKRHLDKILRDVLTPDEIKSALQTIVFETEDMSMEEIDIDHDAIAVRIGVFVSKLIQNSYNAGYNDFKLVTYNFPRTIDSICYRLKGNKKRLLKISIEGDWVEGFSHSSYCEAEFKLHSGTNLPVLFGSDSHKCMFTFNKESAIDKIHCLAVESIYKTADENILSVLIHDVIASDLNQVVFINPDGTEEGVVRHTNYPSNDGVLINQKYKELVRKSIAPRNEKELPDWIEPNNIIVDKLDVVPIGKLYQLRRLYLN